MGGIFFFARDNCMYIVQESHRFKNTWSGQNPQECLLQSVLNYVNFHESMMLTNINIKICICNGKYHAWPLNDWVSTVYRFYEHNTRDVSWQKQESENRRLHLTLLLHLPRNVCACVQKQKSLRARSSFVCVFQTKTLCTYS